MSRTLEEARAAIERAEDSLALFEDFPLHTDLALLYPQTQSRFFVQCFFHSLNFATGCAIKIAEDIHNDHSLITIRRSCLLIPHAIVPPQWLDISNRIHHINLPVSILLAVIRLSIAKETK